MRIRIKRTDPDSYQIGKQDPDPYQSEKQDPDPSKGPGSATLLVTTISCLSSYVSYSLDSFLQAMLVEKDRACQ
jgi:hypothetical protein